MQRETHISAAFSCNKGEGRSRQCPKGAAVGLAAAASLLGSGQELRGVKPREDQTHQGLAACSAAKSIVMLRKPLPAAGLVCLCPSFPVGMAAWSMPACATTANGGWCGKKQRACHLYTQQTSATLWLERNPCKYRSLHILTCASVQTASRPKTADCVASS